MLLNDAITGTQSQARALPDGLRSVKGIEDTVRLLRSRTIVGEFQHREIFPPSCAHRENTALLRHGMKSIIGDVQTDLQKLIGIAQDLGQVTGQVGAHLNVASSQLGLTELDCRLGQGIDVEQNFLGGNLLGETEQAGNERFRAPRLVA